MLIISSDEDEHQQTPPHQADEAGNLQVCYAESLLEAGVEITWVLTMRGIVRKLPHPDEAQRLAIKELVALKNERKQRLKMTMVSVYAPFHFEERFKHFL